MRSPHTLKPPTPHLNITPLIDVVFLLIIFFLVSSNLMRQEVSVEVNLPAAETGEITTSLPPTTLVLSLPRDGELLLGAEQITLATLAQTLQQLIQRKQDTNKIAVRLRIARQTPYHCVEPVLALCSEYQIGDVAFAVLEQQKQPRITPAYHP